MQVLAPEFLSSVALGRQASAVTSFHAREGLRPFNGRISRGYLFFRASRRTIRLFSKLAKNKNKNRELAACRPFLTIWGQVLFLVDLPKTKNWVRFLAQK